MKAAFSKNIFDIEDIIIIIFLIVAIIMGVLIIRKSKSAENPLEFEYKKHDYIYFPGKGIIHSPECKQCTLTFETI